MIIMISWDRLKMWEVCVGMIEIKRQTAIGCIQILFGSIVYLLQVLGVGIT